MSRAIRQPLLHAQEVYEFSPVLADFHKRQVILCECPKWRHQREHRAAHLTRNITQSIDHEIYVFLAQIPCPDIHETPVESFVVAIGMKIDWRHTCDEITYFARM